ncbi:glycosyltransferase family 4 protein [Sphingomonas sp. MMS24-J45]|uniref:glycosyltransferase family 4 protein n=1 Tax=Sphingomonas sp. MMS24-J45 TaxID=3238806 RepID=UPI00384C7B8A
MLVQPGARHNYALARFLNQHGMLQRLYTDFALGTGHPLRGLSHLPLPANVKARLNRRATDAVPARKVRSGVNVAVPGGGRRTLRRPSARDVAESDGFYLQYFTDGAELRARAPRKPIISDVFIVPSAYRAVDREVADFPDWGEAPTSPELGRRYDTHSLAMFEQSDILFCPSQAVIDDVARHGARFASKCRLVPYGASLHAGVGTPEPGRILFCGSLHLRKGVQYIRAAADMLRDSHPHIRFVFAGSGSATTRVKLAAPNTELLGHLGKADLLREFARADLFLFPSLAEGAAGTVLEAMASGLPIVATREGGVDFTDGVSGIVLPPRDPEAIADAVVRIVEDRALRAALSAGATHEAEAYSMAAWEARFIAAVSDVF